MKDLNTRMKGYEACYKFLIPSRSYTIIRVDGKTFSKFTKNMNKPFDDVFSEAMDYATIELCKYFNPAFAYTQSDEISLVFADFGIDQEPIFGGKVQKLCSLSASVAATNFNKKLTMLNAAQYEDATDLCEAVIDGSLIANADFDSRVFVIPDYREVANYFVWRQQDASRNSVSMAAYAMFGHKATLNKSNSDKQDMMMEKGVNWNDYAVKYKRGVVVKKSTFEVPSEHSETGFATRSKWTVEEQPIFTQDKEYLRDLIPTPFVVEPSIED